jgi:hypothetical protein
MAAVCQNRNRTLFRHGLAWFLAWCCPVMALGQEVPPSVSTPRSVRQDAGFCLSAARAALERGDLDEAEAWAVQAENAPVRFLDRVKDCFSNGTVKIWREIQLARIREMAAQIDTLVRTEANTPRESREPELYVDSGKWRSEKPSPSSITAMQNQFFAIMEKPMVFDSGQRVPASKPRLSEPKFDRTEISRLAEYLRANHAALLAKKLPPGPQASSEDLLAHACYQFLHGNYENAKTLGLRARLVDEIDTATTSPPEKIVVAATSVETARSLPNKRPIEATSEEESEPAIRGIPNIPNRGQFNLWYLGIGAILGAALVVVMKRNQAKPV